MRGKRPYFWAAAIILSLPILLPALASPTAVGAILRSLPLGWWHFLERNVPQMSVNWSLVITGLICSVVAIGIGQVLLRTFFGHIRNASSPVPPGRWPWRWTLCVYFAIWLLFTVAFGAAGVLRHTTWLMEIQEPWHKARFNVYPELRMMDNSVQELLLDKADELWATRKGFAGLTSYRRELVAENFNVIFYGDTNSQVVAYVIIPRNAKLHPKSLFLASTPEERLGIKPQTELQETLKTLDARYPSRHARAVEH